MERAVLCGHRRRSERRRRLHDHAACDRGPTDGGAGRGSAGRYCAIGRCDFERRLGDARLVSALHATLDSGSTWAAVVAADTLLRRNDPAGIRWLRRQVEQADVPADVEHDGSAFGEWPMRRIVYLLASHDDTASIPALVRLLVRPEHKLVEAGEREVLEAMMAFPSGEAHRRIAAAVAERPWLGPLYSDLKRRRDSTAR